MRIAISEQYPADDIIAYIFLCAGVVVLIGMIAIALYKKYEAPALQECNRPHKTVGSIFDQTIADHPIDPRDFLRRQKEQDAKDQETLDRATEYTNDLSK